MSQLRKTLKQQKLLRSNPASPVLLQLVDSEEEWEADDWLYVSYRRPELVRDNLVDDTDLSDYVKFRLWMARQLALMVYEKKYG